MSHTPTPWSIAQSSNPKNGTAWRDLRAVGDFGEMYIGEALDKDASHIIHCVNTYDQLVEALHALRNEVTGLLGLAETDLRQIVGPTNLTVLQRKLADSDSALAVAEKGA